MILKYYIMMAFRNLKHQPLLGMLKIGGLSISIGSVILMTLYVDFQWQYDRFHKNGSRIYRVSTYQYNEGEIVTRSAMTYSGIGPLMKTTLSGVEKQVRLGKWIANDVVFQFEDKATRTQDFFFAEPSIFELFSFDLKRGDAKTALVEPNSIVLTEKVARQLFGETDPIGKELKMESRKLMKVTGIIEDTPVQSHMKFDILVSYSTWHGTGFAGDGVYGDDHFDYFYTYTYALLYQGTDPGQIGHKLTELVQGHKKTESTNDVFVLQPLLKIHLYSDLQYELNTTGIGKKIWILLGISTVILVLAWVNYFNISTVTTEDQSKAIAMRKVAGASQYQITCQYLTENLLYIIIALLMGLVVAINLIPLVEYLFELELSNITKSKNLIFNPLFFVFIFLSIGTLLSSLLPAIVMSSFQPTQIIRRTITISGLGINIQKCLVISQFAIIIIMLAASIVILKQTRYMKGKDPGFNLSNVLIVKGPLGTSKFENLNTAYTKFINELNAMATISNIAGSRKIPGDDLEIVDKVRLNGADNFMSFNRVPVAPSFFDVYGLTFLAGEAKASINGEHGRIIINEAAMLRLGFKDPHLVLGNQLTFWEKDYQITGVISNYNHLSLHHPVTPTVLDIHNDGFEDGYFSIKMVPDNYNGSIDQIENAFKLAFPNTVFEYFDLEGHYYSQYKPDIDFRRLNLVFTGLALLVACLGLFALSAVMMKKRIREVAIRKILGSSAKSIFMVLSKDFIKLILFGWVIAVPIAWYIITVWLQNFAYRIIIEGWVFLAAGGIATVIALLTISFDMIKTALSNPVDILRGE